MRARKSATGSVKLIPSPSFPVRPPAAGNQRECLLQLSVVSSQLSANGFSIFLSRLSARSQILTTENCELRTYSLPARLDDAGYLSLERQRAETQAADAKLAQKPSRTPAKLAPIVLAAAELRLPRVFHPFCSGCHIPLIPLRALPEGHAEGPQQRPRLVVVLGRGHDGDVHAFHLLHL